MPSASSRRRWRGRPRMTVWCAWKDCGFSMPPAQLFCIEHGREALKILDAKGLIRPMEDLVPVIPKKP